MWRRFCLAAAFMVLALEHPGAAQPSTPRAPGFNRSEPFVPGELLVGFREAAGPAEIEAVLRQHGLEQRATLDAGRGRRALRLVAFALLPGVDIADATEHAIAGLMRNPLVRFAEPNYILQTSLSPNDPRFADLYGLHNIGQTGGAPDADVDAPEAWTSHTGSSSVVVFVIDTGVDYTHEDLAGNVWANPAELNGAPGVDDDGNGYVDDIHGINAITGSGNPMDDMGHGTHVAGTIGARGNNGVGVVGVAWNVSIGACKFLGNTGSGTVADAVKCFQYVNWLKAAGQNVVATNNSWGGSGFSQALLDAMNAADQPAIQPVLHVCAAGNFNSDNDALPSYPASYDVPNIVAVAATDHNDLYAAFSNYGATSVDLAAPGAAILSTVPTSGDPCCSDPAGYRTLSGTSMAAPFVTGAAALVWSAAPGLGASTVKSRLLAGSDPIAGLGANSLKQTVTQGRLNVSTALEIGSDLEPPAAIGTLAVAATGLSSVTLTWHATGDDGYVGAAASYDLRYSTGPLTDASWESASQAEGEPAPQESGSEETFILTGLRPATTYYFALKARDNGANESALSNVALTTMRTGVTVFEDDMSSTGTWVVAGSPSPSLWHRTERGSMSPTYAWWYGIEKTGTYNTGAANWGTLTATVDLTGFTEAGLAFAESSEVEVTPDFDRTRVQASRDGMNWFTLFESHGTAGVWAERWVDLTGYVGQEVLIRFYFDTGDPLLNDYAGWYVDDVTVVGIPAADRLLAAFRAEPTAGFAPLFVQFTDESVSPAGTIASWNWEVAPGVSSIERNPVHTYADPGTYSVSLAVTDSTGSASLTKNAYITVKPTATIASIDYANSGNRGRDLLITVTVENWAGAAIAGATVNADVYRGGTFAKSFTGTTNLDGTLTVKLKNASSGCYRTTVTRVSSTNHEWNGVTPSNSFCK